MVVHKQQQKSLVKLQFLKNCNDILTEFLKMLQLCAF